eukprot:4644131-Amphidinium_carterae.1
MDTYCVRHATLSTPGEVTNLSWALHRISRKLEDLAFCRNRLVCVASERYSDWLRTRLFLNATTTRMLRACDC